MKNKQVQSYYYFLFTFFWVFIGFSLGLSTLIIPLHWISNWVRTYNLGQTFENATVRLIIALFVIISAGAAYLLTRLFIESPRKIKLALVTFIIVSGLSALWLSLNPNYLPGQNNEFNIYNSRFAFGNYPTKEMLQELRMAGYTGVISLLDSKHVPFEGVLLKKEKEIAEEVGMELINLPILPWLDIPQNEISLQKLREIALNPNGRYYIHCNLGQDRIILARKTLQEVTPKEEDLSSSNEKQLYYMRSYSGQPVIRLDQQVYILSQLDHDSLFFLTLNKFRHIVILKDSQDQWSRKTESNLKTNLTPYTTYVLPDYPYDANRILEIVQEIKKLPRPLLIFVPKLESYLTEGFILTYNSDLPSLPLSLFTTPLKQGEIGVIRNNIALGPQPDANEFKFFLFDTGIKSVLYFGNLNTEDQMTNQQGAVTSLLDWKNVKRPFSYDQLNFSQPAPLYLNGPFLPLNHLSRIKNFKKGPIQRLNIQLYLTPTPTLEELQAYFLNGDVDQVIALIDQQTNLEWIKYEKELLEKKGVNFQALQLSEIYNPNFFLNLAQQLWDLPGTTVIQFEDTTNFNAEALRQAYFTQVPPLPPLLFNKGDFKSFNIELVGPNIAVGPPLNDKIQEELLFSHGIRKVIEIAVPSDTEEYLFSPDLTLNCPDNKKHKMCILSQLMKNGPWYIYSSNVDRLKFILKNYLGPNNPSMVLFYPGEGPEPTVNFSDIPVFTLPSKWIPNLGLTILLVPPLSLFVLAVSCGIAWLRRVKRLKTFFTRKIFHITIFTMAGLLQILWGLPAILIFGIIITVCLIFTIKQGKGFAFYDSLVRPYSDEESQKLSVVLPTIATGLGGVISFFLFGEYFLVGLLICGWGDAIAEIVGRFSKHEYQIPSFIGHSSTKTLEGSFAMFLVGTLVGMIALLIIGLSPKDALIVGTISALVGTIVEASSHSYWDNLTIQIFSSGTAYFLSQW